jgi:(1->4)-alpha-D-glucan 1-alpha-D-glucosylmutase
MTTWRDGRIKQVIIRNALAARRAEPELFSDGAYLRLRVEGVGADHVLAFARRHGSAVAIVVVSLRVARWLPGDTIVVPPSRWGDTQLCVPGELARTDFSDVFAGRLLKHGGERIPIARLLNELPVALWLKPSSLSRLGL